MSSEIKNTIGLLCKLLNLLYHTDLKPEYFRLAKFNKTNENVVTILWNLLKRILNEDNILIIKSKLHDLKYRRKQFYSCTEINFNSRELLLTISFLLSSCLEDTIKREMENSVFSYSYEVFGHQHQPLHHIAIDDHKQFDCQKLNEKELENYKKWLYGKTCSNKNTIIEYKQYISRLQDKFNRVLDIKANGNLTVYEIMALKNKTIGEQFILDTELILNHLSVYTEWLKKEKYFWKWMESVIEEGKKELESKTPE